MFRRKYSQRLTTAEFWNWWASFKREASNAIESGNSASLESEITAKVSAFDDRLDWEISEGLTARHAFVVTSGGNPETRSLAHRLIADAPEADATFEYHDNRRPQLGVQDTELEVGGVKVDLSLIAVSTKLDESSQVLDIEVYHPMFEMLGDEAIRVAFLFVDWTLGEANVERWIGGLDAVSRRPPNAVDRHSFARAVAELEGQVGGPSWVKLNNPGDERSLDSVFVKMPLKPIDFPLFDRHVRATFDRKSDQVEPDFARIEREFGQICGCALVAIEHRSDEFALHFYVDSEGDSFVFLTKLLAEGSSFHSLQDHMDPQWNTVIDLSISTA